VRERTAELEVANYDRLSLLDNSFLLMETPINHNARGPAESRRSDATQSCRVVDLDVRNC